MLQEIVTDINQQRRERTGDNCTTRATTPATHCAAKRNSAQFGPFGHQHRFSQFTEHKADQHSELPSTNEIIEGLPAEFSQVSSGPHILVIALVKATTTQQSTMSWTQAPTSRPKTWKKACGQSGIELSHTQVRHSDATNRNGPRNFIDCHN